MHLVLIVVLNVKTSFVDHLMFLYENL